MDDKELTGLQTIQAIIDGRQLVPYQDNLSIIFTKASIGELEAECILSADQHGNGFNGNVHGGVIAGFADAVSGFCFVTTLANEKKPFVASLTTDFLNPAVLANGNLRARATVQNTNARKSSGLVDVEIKQGETIVAMGRARMVVPRQS